MKTILSLSGGMDSATLLAYCLAQGGEVEAVSFSYGSKHNSYEKAGAVKIAEHYGVKLHHIDLRHIMVDFRSNLLKTGGDIPEGHYTDKSMSATVVPGRNMIFLSILTGLGESVEADQLAIGIHAGDHAIYPDCRPGFYVAMNAAIQESTEGKLQIYAPFLEWDKTKILEWGVPNGVPYKDTRTCYKDQSLSCGLCGSCVERLEAWAAIGCVDPIPYA